MNLERCFFLKIALLFVCIALLFSACAPKESPAEKAVRNYSEILETGQVEDFTLTVYYYSDPFLLTSSAITFEFLTYFCDAIDVVAGFQLTQYEALFRELTIGDVEGAENVSYLNARMGYTLETEEDGIILEVAFGTDQHLFVNGEEIKYNNDFYQLVRPFLPENAQQNFDNFVADIWPTG